MNRYNLERLVIKTYRFVKNTVFDSKKHKNTVVEIILAMYRANNIEFDDDYFTENILEIFKDLETSQWKLYDKSFNTEQVFIY